MSELRVTALADIEEFERIPIEERLEAFNTYDLLKTGAAKNPDGAAISFIPSGEEYDRPIVISYRDFLAQVTRTANLFHDLGLGPKDVISYLLPNLPQTHFTLWGGEATGVVNPINPLLEPATIADICRAAGTKVLVALGETPGAEIWPKVEAVRRELPELKAVIRVPGPGDEKNGVIGFDEAVAKYDGDKLDSGRIIEPTDMASMYHTGGTTGTPKLAPHSHFNEAVMAFMTAAVLGFKPGDAALCGLPLFHVNGTTVTGSAPFLSGAHVVLLSPAGYRDPAIIKNFYKIIERYRAIMFSAVPTILSVLLEVPKGGADISSLRFLVCGAAPLSVELFQRFEDYTGLSILEGYGLTEGTCVSAVNPLYGERKIGSVGLRLPYHKIKIGRLDEDGRLVREAETDEIGSVLISGPNVFNGYLDEAHNQGVWAEEGWFNTGDLGRMDADGYLWLTGRKKELIIRGGHNIDPALIEDPLYRLEGVAVAAAVPWPDPYAGEVPAVYVQLQEGVKMTPEDILDYLKAEVGERAAIPKQVLVIDQMPLTAVGKIFKPALKWDAVKRAFTAELAALGELAESVTVEVGEDKIHGTLAVIGVKPARDASAEAVEAKVHEILANYAVKYRVETD